MPVVRINEPITDWEEGDFVQGFVLVSRRDARSDRNGREYLDLELADASGSVTAKVWPDSPALKATFEEKDFIFFKGTTKRHRDQLQVSLDHCRRATEGDREKGFTPETLVPTTPEDHDGLKRRLAAIYPAAIGRPSLRRVAEEALARYGDALSDHPAAKSIHHAYRGGLLEHVVNMAELAGRICDQYGEVDRDLVLLGVLFHDLGKLREIGAMPRNEYTLEGQLVGHVVIGYGMVRDCCAAAGDLDDELRHHLEHLVVSHQGRREYGSAQLPSTPEALVLHAVDDLDSKLAQLRALRRTEGPGLHFVRAFGRNVFLGEPADD